MSLVDRFFVKGETSYTEVNKTQVDKPTSYKEKENVLENEEEDIATGRKEKGKIIKKDYFCLGKGFYREKSG